MVNSEGAGGGAFARSLAHTEHSVREKAFKRLAKWLGGHKGGNSADPSQQDYLKIWKGLFYAFWHSDLEPVQRELAERMAKLLFAFGSPKESQLFFAAFLATMRREWFGIDKLRMDKFMMLVRTFIDSMYSYLESLEWELGAVEGYMRAVTEHGVSDELTKGIGFLLHLTDVYMVQMAAGRCTTAPCETMAALLAPFQQVLATHSNVTVLNRVQEEVFSEGILRLQQSQDMGAVKANELRLMLAAQCRELAEEPEAAASTKNRRFLFDTAKLLEKQAKKAVKANKRAASDMESAAAAPEPEPEPEPAPPKKAKKKKANGLETRHASASGAEDSPETSNNTSRTSKTSKNKSPESSHLAITPEMAQELQSPAEWSDGAVADDWGVEGVVNNSKKKKKSKKGDGTSLDCPGSEDLPTTPTPTLPAPRCISLQEETLPAQVEPATKRRKSVRIVLKNNLYFSPNSKPLDPSIRTPVRAQPKGPALKKVSKWPNTFTPQSAPAKISRPSYMDTCVQMVPATEGKTKIKGNKKNKQIQEHQVGIPGSTPGAKKRDSGAMSVNLSFDGVGGSDITGHSSPSTRRRSRAIDYF